jgi:glycosyltransferase involved in cell wall biosynthesis
MRTLVVTPFPPPGPNDVQALFRRLGTFVGALGEISDQIEMLHYVPDGHPAFAIDRRKLNDDQSARWGASVTVTLAVARAVDASAARLALTLVSALSHPAYHPFAGRRQAAALCECLDRRPDLIFVHRLFGMGSLLRIRRRLPPILFDLDDVEHWVKLRAALGASPWFAKLPRLAQVPAIFASERRAILMATRTFVCSETDRRYLQRWGLTGIVTIPNAVLISSEPTPVAPKQTVMLIGAYHYRPNIEAAERLITAIWPLIRARVPEAELIIAGSNPEFIPAFRSRPPGVVFTGIVDDLDALYRRTRVVCCPISNGGGTRLKLIEAAAHAKPMISTTIGAEGLCFRDGAEILIRDDDRSIAHACIQLLHDDARCAVLGRSAFRAARENYDCSAVQELIVAEATRVLALDKTGAPQSGDSQFESCPTTSPDRKALTLLGSAERRDHE